jgi:superfamily I DNA and/or RNA helicase/very-short-patch-repair endonuclease
MSPLTVSQLLDPEIFEFDIAIFDEASQIPPEYAVGTIARAKQVVIAGDRHQLPPTRFFNTIVSDDDEDDYEIEDYESILNAFDAISLPNKMLLWHYRSEDEALIAFSNYNFYDNRLLTFPNSAKDKKTTGLEFVFVSDGVYRRGKGARNNPIEARRVAKLVFELLEKSPQTSIGVITFSQSQREVVEQEINRLKAEKPELYSLFDYNKEEQVFVKNLETVQGDERDIIIFSIGYGKDEAGKMSMNFGPLNRQGGERRLNVAVTRARKAVKLVTSIKPEDIDLSRTESLGAKLLKSYMKVAKEGVIATFEEETFNPHAEFDSPFEEAVYDALSRRGIILHKQVGVSQYRIDLGVVDSEQPGRYLLGIECDGAAYHSSPTARDRDRLRQQLLEEKFGWRIHRIWSRDWINNPHTEIEKVLSAIEKSKASYPKQPVKKN